MVPYFHLIYPPPLFTQITDVGCFAKLTCYHTGNLAKVAGNVTNQDVQITMYCLNGTPSGVLGGGVQRGPLVGKV